MYVCIYIYIYIYILHAINTVSKVVLNTLMFCSVFKWFLITLVPDFTPLYYCIIVLLHLSMDVILLQYMDIIAYKHLNKH